MMLNSKSTGAACVVVIGSGAAGLAVAETLLRSGVKVILVCGATPDSDSRSANLQEESDFQRSFHESLLENRVRGLGGTTERWGGRLVEFSESDFHRKNTFLGTPWPISKGDLEPYYEKSLIFFGLTDTRYRLIEDKGFTFDELRQVMNASASEKFETFSKVADLNTPELWTQIGNVFYSKIQQLKKYPTFVLYEDWHLTELNYSSNGSYIKSSTISKIDGTIEILEGSYFVLACGAIENSRQLLLLKQRVSGELEKSLTNVGLGYSSHVFLQFSEISKPNDFFWDFMRVRHGFLRNRIRFDHESRAGVLNVAMFFSYPSLKKEDFGFQRILYFFKKYGFKLLLSPSSVFVNFRKLRKLIGNKSSDNSSRTDNSKGKQCLHLQIEKLSNEDSRIVLGDKLDILGNQLPNCRLYFSPLEKHAYREICLLVKDLYSHLSISEEVFMNQIDDFSSNPNSHAHQIGGTIMGNSPMDSVVNSDCRVHGIGNLFVAGSSVFTTAGEANPTHTIVAMGIKTGEFISKSLLDSND